jgi:hypothetical protein
MLNNKFLLSIILFYFLFFSLYSYSQSDTNKKISVKQYIETYKAIAINNMINYKIPASITLSQGILESANGNSDLAITANNHFGIKCHKDWQGEKYFKDDDEKNECFRVYKDASESFKDHSAFLRSRERYTFLFFFNINDYKSWAQGLKEAGYATNPKYPQLLIKIIEDYKLFELDNENLNAALLAKSEFDEIGFKSSSDDSEDFESVLIGNGSRKVYLNNRVQFIFAKKGDNFFSIAEEFELKPNEIIRYNDYSKEYKIKTGEKIYIKPKRRRGFAEFHIVRKNETMLEISQLYGIKLKLLYKKNRMEKEEKPKTGQKLWLKKTKPK